MPAGLKAVPANNEHFRQAEKETAQALPEAISQDWKGVSEIWTPPYKTPAPLEPRQAERRTFGLKRRTFRVTFASLVLILALVVGVGSGLGVKRSRKAGTCDSGTHPRWENADVSDP